MAPEETVLGGALALMIAAVGEPTAAVSAR